MGRCGACAKLTVEELRGGMTFYHANLRSLRDAAAAGCDMCQLCWTSIQQRNMPQEIDAVLAGQCPEGSGVGPLYDERVWLTGSFLDAFRGRGGSGRPAPGSTSVGGKDYASQVWLDCGRTADAETTVGPPMLSSMFWVFADPGTPAASRFVERYISADRNPNGHIEFGGALLRICQKRHPECGPADLDAAPEMPTRVLDVGTSPDSTKLVYARKDGLRKPYLALSYCWGQGARRATELHDDNLASLIESIDETTLTASHRECITLARELGIQYVWIDSLCIIQGNAADWSYESKRMAEVYGNATLTVVAARSADSQLGFVTNQPPQQAPFCALPLGLKDDSGKDMGQVFLYLPCRTFPGPLNVRGWCFQEGILSRRNLVFETGRIYFSCQRTTRREEGTMEPSYKLRTLLFQSLPEPGWQLDQLRTEMLRIWYKMFLENYTRRQLSNPADIFAAISGIAQPAQRSIRSRYLAGIWETDIVAGLLWNTMYSFLGVRRNAPKNHPITAIRPKRPVDKEGNPVVRAPSWSWASIMGQVQEPSTPRNYTIFRDPSNFLIRPCEDNAKNVPIWTTPNSPHCDTDVLHMPFCELRFLGRPKQVRCLPTWSEVPDFTRKWRNTPHRKAEYGYLVLLEPAESEQAQLNKLGLLPAKDTSASDALVFGEAFFDVSEERPGVTDCWFLPILKEKWMGLLLHKDPSDGKFRRLGIVVVGKDQFLPWVLSGPEEEVHLV